MTTNPNPGPPSSALNDDQLVRIVTSGVGSMPYKAPEQLPSGRSRNEQYAKFLIDYIEYAGYQIIAPPTNANGSAAQGVSETTASDQESDTDEDDHEWWVRKMEQQTAEGFTG